MPQILYDVSRLSTRVLNASPNGIDRIDFSLARWCLSGGFGDCRPLLFGFNGPRLFYSDALPDPTHALDEAWRERESDDQIARALDILIEGLGRGSARAQSVRKMLLTRARANKVAHIARALLRYGFRSGGDPCKLAPRNAIYLNASHYPLELRGHTQWLMERKDIKFVMFVHDLLPISHPEYFWPKESEKHSQRLGLLARIGAGAIVTSTHVAQKLEEHMRAQGRRAFPIVIARPPVDEDFLKPAYHDPRLAKLNYMVMCGTLEPRKNHMFILKIWQRLAHKLGAKTPKLIIMGKRGWHYQQIVAQLKRPELRDHVLEVAGLSTPAYRALLRHARALISCSLDEGLGLPIAEALTMGTPVIAGDIAPYREQAQTEPVYLSLSDPEIWLKTIEDFAMPASPMRATAVARTKDYVSKPAARYFETIDRFLCSL